MNGWPRALVAGVLAVALAPLLHPAVLAGLIELAEVVLSRLRARGGVRESRRGVMVHAPGPADPGRVPVAA